MIVRRFGLRERSLGHVNFFANIIFHSNLFITRAGASVRQVLCCCLRMLQHLVTSDLSPIAGSINTSTITNQGTAPGHSIDELDALVLGAWRLATWRDPRSGWARPSCVNVARDRNPGRSVERKHFAGSCSLGENVIRAK